MLWLGAVEAISARFGSGATFPASSRHSSSGSSSRPPASVARSYARSTISESSARKIGRSSFDAFASPIRYSVAASSSSRSAVISHDRAERRDPGEPVRAQQRLRSRLDR